MPESVALVITFIVPSISWIQDALNFVGKKNEKYELLYGREYRQLAIWIQDSCTEFKKVSTHQMTWNNFLQIGRMNIWFETVYALNYLYSTRAIKSKQSTDLEHMKT